MGYARGCLNPTHTKRTLPNIYEMSIKNTLLAILVVITPLLTSCLEINDIHPEDSTEELCVSPVAATTTKAPIDGAVSLPRYHSDGSTLRKL